MEERIHFDPRVKLLLFCVTCCFVMTVIKPIPNLCQGLFLAVMLCLSGKWRFAGGCFGMMLLASGGSVLILNRQPGIAGLPVIGVSVLFRMMIPVIMAFTLVFQTTNTSQFMAALQKMKLPVKAVIPIVILFRFVPTVREEWIAIQKAMAFRGIALNPPGVLRHPVRSIERVLIPLLFSAASIIEELAAASLAGGLDSDRRRTCLLRTRMGGWDYVCLIITPGYAWVWLSGSVR